MIKTTLALLGILAVLTVLICYGYCVVAGWADEEMERIMEDET